MRTALWRRELLLVSLIVLVAVFFRSFRLDSLPRGMIGDEALHGLEAQAIAQGGYYPVFVNRLSALPMYDYWIAILFRSFGASLFAARAGAAVVGIATVPVFYLLAKELFASTGTRSRRLIAVSATYLLATSYWHVVYSRVAREMILAPLFSILVLYYLVRAWRSRRRFHFVLCGISLGLAVYAYPTSYFLPLLVVVLLGYYIWRQKGALRTQWANLLLLFGISFAVATPLALFAVRETHVFVTRASEVTFLNRDLTDGSPLAAFALSAAKTAAMFVFQGDSSLVHNPASRPVLDPISSVWFVLGCCVAIRKWREPTYFMLLAWLPIMCLPAVVTVLTSANFSRTIGALPVTCILPALGMVSALEWLEAGKAVRPLATVLATLVIAVTLLVATVTTYRDYFVTWDTREDLRQGYDGAYTLAAATMNETRVPDSVWILPLTSLAQAGYGSDHFDFLYQGDSPYYTLRVDEATGAEELSTYLRVAHKALVVDWKGYVLERAYEAISADPKNLISFLMQKYGRELDRRSYEAFDVVTYQVPESPTFSIAEQFEPLAVDFGDELRLTGVAFGGSSLQDTSTPEEVERRQLPSGKSGWVVLRWRATREPSRSYKVAVYLEDQGGHIAGQVDKLLLCNCLRTTRDWDSGQEEIDYYTLPSWNGSPPGWYKVGVTVYDADSGEVLYRRNGERSYELGTMEIVRPLAFGQVKPEVSIGEEEGEIAGGIRLLGYDMPQRELNPGDELSVALYWQATTDVDRNYLLSVEVTDEQGAVAAEESDAPAHGSYPTVDWIEGETIKEWHDLRLPTDTAQGRYQVFVVVGEEGTLLRRIIGLEEVLVRGRPRQFAVPQIQNPLEARLGQGVQFLGYDLNSKEIRAGETLRLTLYWQALAEMDTSYTVFTHLLDARERVWGQMDSIPLRGQARTTSWVSGEVIADDYEIAVDAGAPPGEYAIEIGMYDAGTGRRLPIAEDGQLLEGDRLVLGQIRVMS